MEKEIKERYNKRIFQEARSRYGIEPDKIRLLDGFESFIYEFEREDGSYILRISHSHRRTPDLIRGEIDWINYLKEGGVGVAKAVPSSNGIWVEVIDDQQGRQFLVTAFVKAKGSPPWKVDFWETDESFERYGRLLGRIHALSKDYIPAKKAWRRLDWDHPINLNLKSWLPPSESNILEQSRELIGYLRSLPKDRESYGLIHQDAHGANLFVDGDGTITLFDFDDCVYGWYVYDLAMVLFYAVTNREDADEFGPRFWRPFMRGYQQENKLEQGWMAEIPHFLKLREIDLYAVIHRSHDVNNLVEVDPWGASFMNDRKEKIESGLPYVNFDVSTEMD